MKLSSLISIFISAICCVVFIQPPAMAYVGPGTGIAALGALLAIIAGIVVAVFGFLWYPLKRLRKRKAEAAAASKVEEREGVKEEI